MAWRRPPDDILYAIPGSEADYRRRVQQAELERTALRDSELEAQTSLVRDPQERIGIWERLHALRLPRAPEHVLVKVIARQTRLTIGQVHDEQQRRAAVISQPRELPADRDGAVERDADNVQEPVAPRRVL